MFVRLKKRSLRRSSDYSLDAVLVASIRKDGKVRQKFIKHLASIRGSDIKLLARRMAFWEEADQAMDCLRLDRCLRKSIEQKLDQKVPKPTEAEKAGYLDDLAEVREELYQLGLQRRNSR